MRYFLLTLLLVVWYTQTVAVTDVVSHATLPTSLVSYWQLEEESSTRVDTPGVNDLTSVNVVGYAAGKQGNAADMEDGSNQSLKIVDADQSGLDLTGSFSINLWIKPESFSSDTPLVGKWQHATNNQYMVYYDATTLYLITDNSCSGFTYANVGKSHGMSTGNWYMVTVTYTSGTNTVEFWVNGSSLGTATGQTPSNCGADFYLGDRHGNGVPQFDGLMDEVGIWSKVLSSTEIADLYNSGNGIPYQAAAGSNIATTPVTINGGTLRVSGGMFINTQ